MLQHSHLTSIYVANRSISSSFLLHFCVFCPSRPPLSFLGSILYASLRFFFLLYAIYPSLFHPYDFWPVMPWFWSIQEVFLRPMQLCVTTMELAAKKKCSGWECYTTTHIQIFLSFRIFLCHFLIFIWLFLCFRMLTLSTTLRTTESSTYWISATLTAGNKVYWCLNHTEAYYDTQASTQWKGSLAKRSLHHRTNNEE